MMCSAPSRPGPLARARLRTAAHCVGWIPYPLRFDLLLIQRGPDASAPSVGRVARLSGNVRQPNHVLVNEIAGHKAERRPGAGEEWLAATKHDGVEVKSILIYKTKVG